MAAGLPPDHQVPFILSHSASLLIVSGHHNIHLYSYSSEVYVYFMLFSEVDNVIHCMDICKAGERVITVGKDLKVRIYDEVSMQVTHSRCTEYGGGGSSV